MRVKEQQKDWILCWFICLATRRWIFQEQADLPVPDKGSEKNWLMRFLLSSISEWSEANRLLPLNVFNQIEFNGIHTSMTAIFAAAFAHQRAEWCPSVRLFSFVLKSSDPVHTFESTKELAACNLSQQLHTPHVQNSKFFAPG